MVAVQFRPRPAGPPPTFPLVARCALEEGEQFRTGPGERWHDVTEPMERIVAFGGYVEHRQRPQTERVGWRKAIDREDVYGDKFDTPTALAQAMDGEGKVVVAILPAKPKENR